jgi:hypothetical protein
MKANYLFPHRFKRIGWFFFLPSILFGILWLLFLRNSDLTWFSVKVPALIDDVLFNGLRFFVLTETIVIEELLAIFLIISSLFVAFSKEKYEDEFIMRVRLESLLWATYVNYFVLLFTILFIYGTIFIDVLIVNMFTLLLFFIVRFNWQLHKLKIELKNEK